MPGHSCQTPWACDDVRSLPIQPTERTFSLARLLAWAFSSKSRSRKRPVLHGFDMLNDHVLRDIGLTRDQGNLPPPTSLKISRPERRPACSACNPSTKPS